MLDQLLLPLTWLAALGSALMAGTFFAFSAFVMRALGRLPAANGAAAMQSINIAVINPVFLGVFLGTALVAGAVSVLALLAWQPRSPWLLAGAAFYLLGTLVVTIVGNVPLNDALARVAPGSPEAAAHWPRYLSQWTRWNHVRTVAPLAALACFIMALGGAS